MRFPPDAWQSIALSYGHGGGQSLITDPKITGKRLAEIDAELFEETLERLQNHDLSPTGAVLGESETRRLAENLGKARVRGMCGCGQDDCRTYYFQVPRKPQDSVAFETVRFCARGEHMLHVDSDGDIYSLERLDDAGGVARYILARTREGKWEQRKL
jgi:hypothetical protein